MTTKKKTATKNKPRAIAQPPVSAGHEGAERTTPMGIDPGKEKVSR